MAIRVQKRQQWANIQIERAARGFINDLAVKNEPYDSREKRQQTLARLAATNCLIARLSPRNFSTMSSHVCDASHFREDIDVFWRTIFISFAEGGSSCESNVDVSIFYGETLDHRWPKKMSDASESEAT